MADFDSRIYLKSKRARRFQAKRTKDRKAEYGKRVEWK